MRQSILIAFGVILAGCRAEPAQQEETYLNDVAALDARADLEADRAEREAALLESADKADEAGARSFAGYACTEDCSGHEAGYAWAEEQGITDPDECGGNSDSFIEGCVAYAEEQESDDSGLDVYDSSEF